MDGPYRETVLPSAARTTAQVAGLRNQAGLPNCLVIVDCTLDPSTASITPSVEVEVDLGADFVLWTAAAAIAATGQFMYLFTPFVMTDFITAVTEDQLATLPLNSVFKMAVAGAQSMTYSVEAHWF